MKTENNTPEHFEDTLQQIGEKLYRLRHERREKLTTVANRVGVSTPVISKIENGHYTALKLDLLYRLAHYYNVPFSELVL